jgi:hypothetical protein
MTATLAATAPYHGPQSAHSRNGLSSLDGAATPPVPGADIEEVDGSSPSRPIHAYNERLRPGADRANHPNTTLVNT